MVDAGTHRVPDVSVVIPAYNAMPYLLACLESLVEQTIGHDRMEIIVVNDGSRDGTGEELDRWAAAHPDLFRVVHHTGSGGPATPRNTGLDLARGRYVYFVDADDYLGVEALDRLVRTADEHSSDIVLGRMRGVGGRGVPKPMFEETDPDVDLYRSSVYWTLAPLKLFRRDFIEAHSLRFPTQFPNASDQPFTAQAYLRASKISVNGDYDYYYAVRRDDGQHVTSSGSFGNRMDVVEWMCDLLAREVPDLARREHLLRRHFSIELRRAVSHIARSSDANEQDVLLERLRSLVQAHLSPTLFDSSFPPILRAALLGVADGADVADVRVAHGRMMAARTLKRWTQKWDGTDLVVCASIGGDLEEQAALVASHAGRERLFGASVADGTVTGRIPVADLGEGRWSLRLRLGTAPAHVGFPVGSNGSIPDHSWRSPRRTVASLLSDNAGGAILEVSAPSLRSDLISRARSVRLWARDRPHR